MPAPLNKKAKKKSHAQNFENKPPVASTWKYIVGGALVGVAVLGLAFGILATLSGFGAIAGIPILAGSVGVLAGISTLCGSLALGAIGAAMTATASPSNQDFKEYNKKIRNQNRSVVANTPVSTSVTPVTKNVEVKSAKPNKKGKNVGFIKNIHFQMAKFFKPSSPPQDIATTLAYHYQKKNK